MSKDVQQSQVPKPEARLSAVPHTPLSVRCFAHKGEVVVVFSQPVGQWFMPPDAAREFSRVFTELAAQLDMQEAGRSIKQ